MLPLNGKPRQREGRNINDLGKGWRRVAVAQTAPPGPPALYIQRTAANSTTLSVTGSRMLAILRDSASKAFRLASSCLDLL